MSIVSKFLVIFVVVLTVGFVVMVATYATIQPNYRVAYEDALRQAEAASLQALAGNVDRFINEPRHQMEVATAESEKVKAVAAKDVAVREANEAKADSRLTATRIQNQAEHLAQIQAKLNAYEDLLSKSQEAQRELRSDLTKMQQDLFAAQKKAAETEVHSRFVTAKNDTLIAQAKALDARIREMENNVKKAEAVADKIAEVLAAIRAGGSDTTLGNQEGFTGIDGVSPEVASGAGKGSRDLLESVRIRAKILEVQMDDRIPYVTINHGEDDRIRVGMMLHVFRMDPPEYIGVLRITRVDYQRAAGRVDLLRQGKVIRQGDEVTNDLKTLR